jgi:hypothetical protein
MPAVPYQGKTLSRAVRCYLATLIRVKVQRRDRERAPSAINSQ